MIIFRKKTKNDNSKFGKEIPVEEFNNNYLYGLKYHGLLSDLQHLDDSIPSLLKDQFNIYITYISYGKIVNIHFNDILLGSIKASYLTYPRVMDRKIMDCHDSIVTLFRIIKEFPKYSNK